MQPDELDTFIQHLVDEIHAEPDLAHRALLLRTLDRATDRICRKAMMKAAYDMRAAGYSAEQVTTIFDMDAHTGARWADQHAHTYGLPKVTAHRPKYTIKNYVNPGEG